MFCIVVNFLSGSVGHFNFATLLKFTVSLDMIDLIFLEEELNTLAHSGCNVAASFHHSFDVGSGFFHVDTVVCSVLNVFEYAGALKQCFGGNTTPVRTNATQFRFLDNTYFHPQLRSTDCSNITSGSGA